jgi:hypothetical protein
MPTCGNCGGGYFAGISGGMMAGPYCRCGNRGTTASPRPSQNQRTNSGISAGMSMQRPQSPRSYPQQRVQGQRLSTTTDSVPLGVGIAIGLVLGFIICLGFVVIF